MARYDSRTTLFSPEGRILQIEYAMKAISHAPPALGFRCTDGVLLCCRKDTSSKLVDVSRLPAEKIYRIDTHVMVGIAGLTHDSNVLITEARVTAQRYRAQFNEPIPIDYLVQTIANIKQRFTQRGSSRPFGVSILFAGWDSHSGFQLYQSDPAGQYSGWVASVIGEGSHAAMSLLRDEADAVNTVDDACALTLRAIGKTIDASAVSEDKIEMAAIKLVDGKPVITFFTDARVAELCSEWKQSLDNEN